MQHIVICIAQWAGEWATDRENDDDGSYVRWSMHAERTAFAVKATHIKNTHSFVYDGNDEDEQNNNRSGNGGGTWLDGNRDTHVCMCMCVCWCAVHSYIQSCAAFVHDVQVGKTENCSASNAFAYGVTLALGQSESMTHSMEYTAF